MNSYWVSVRVFDLMHGQRRYGFVDLLLCYGQVDHIRPAQRLQAGIDAPRQIGRRTEWAGTSRSELAGPLA
jgi:hypothetical protein